MIPWCDQRLTAVDLESTSVDPFTARMVTGCVAYVGGGQDTEVVQVLADPGVEIPAEATAVHGVTTEHAQANGLPGAAAVAVILEAIARRPDGSAVICMNARFDLTILECEARRHGLVPLSEHGRLLVIDPRVCDLWLDRYRPGPRKLMDLCRHYSARLDGAHDAAYDAIAAARVAWRIGMHADVVRRVRDHDEAVELTALRREWDAVRHHLPALHDAQIGWACDQAAGLEEHFASKGEPQPVDGSWPILQQAAEVPA